MAKTASTDLFELIQSMCPSEKRYYKLYAQRHSNEFCNSLKIFDAIEAMDQYNEALLFQQFKKEPFIKRFSITKARLYDQILGALCAFHSNKSITAQLHHLLNAIEILFEKALYDQCNKLTRSAQKLAEKHEKYDLLLSIKNWEKKLLENTGYNIESDSLKELILSSKNTLHQIDELQGIWSLKSELMYQLNHKGKSVKKEEIKLINQTIKDVEQFPINSNEAKYAKNHLLSACYFAKADFIQCTHHLEENYTFLNTHKEKVKADPPQFLSTSSNLIYVKIKLGDFEAAHQLLAALKSFRNQFNIDWHADIDIKWFSSYRSIELIYRTAKGDTSALQRMVEELDTDLENYADKLSPVRLTYFLFKKAEIEIKLNASTAAAKTLSKIINNNLDQREDFFTYARLMQVIVQYDLRQYDLLPYTLRSLKRYIQPKKEAFHFEMDFLSFINKSLKLENDQERSEMWSDFIENTESTTCQNNPYFDFYSWIEAKASGRQMTVK